MRKIFRILKKISIVTVSLVLLLFVTTYFYMQQEKFGKAPTEERLERIKKSPHFKNGKFRNINFTPSLTEGYSYWEILYDFFLGKHQRRRPIHNIPSMKTDLLTLHPDENVLIWFGHSSYYIQIDGVKILADPVFSGNASPVPGSNKAFKGTDRYTVDDLPDIDYLFISHDHYDHVDHETLLQLKSKTKKVFCGLGVGSHFENWGYDTNQIIEKDWYESEILDSGFIIHTIPTRHFSGRGFSRDNTLWLSYLIETPSMKIYIGGDSGYDTHFAEAGEKFGPIDLAILEDGQYDIKWKYIHLLPEDVLQAAKDLKAKRLFPVHSSKFAMANHPWDEPLIKISELNNGDIPLVTPIIGEVVNLHNENQPFRQWWLDVK